MTGVHEPRLRGVAGAAAAPAAAVAGEPRAAAGRAAVRVARRRPRRVVGRVAPVFVHEGGAYEVKQMS